jgi:hypothetical protein
MHANFHRETVAQYQSKTYVQLLQFATFAFVFFADDFQSKNKGEHNTYFRAIPAKAS